MCHLCSRFRALHSDEAATSFHPSWSRPLLFMRRAAPLSLSSILAFVVRSLTFPLIPVLSLQIPGQAHSGHFSSSSPRFFLLGTCLCRWRWRAYSLLPPSLQAGFYSDPGGDCLWDTVLLQASSSSPLSLLPAGDLEAGGSLSA